MALVRERLAVQAPRSVAVSVAGVVVVLARRSDGRGPGVLSSRRTCAPHRGGRGSGHGDDRDRRTVSAAGGLCRRAVGDPRDARGHAQLGRRGGVVVPRSFGPYGLLMLGPRHATSSRRSLGRRSRPSSSTTAGIAPSSRRPCASTSRRTCPAADGRADVHAREHHRLPRRPDRAAARPVPAIRRRSST